MKIKPFKIGNVTVKNNIILAPMAGYGDIAFRRLCRDFGAGLTVTEMISAKGLIYGNEKTAEMLRLAPNETPSCVQLFGNEPEAFYRAIKMPELEKFDIIDINAGCPAPKITRSGEGGALLKDLSLLGEIVAAAVSAAGTRPVTLKTRLGYDLPDKFLKAAETAKNSGAAMLTLHARTVKEMYSGAADVKIIEDVTDILPVCANGDINSQNIGEISDKFAAVMIGRGALGDPAVFVRAAGGNSDFTKKQTALKHLRYMTEYFDERYTVVNMRKHFIYYLKGLKNQKSLKLKLMSAENIKNLINIIESADWS